NADAAVASSVNRARRSATGDSWPPRLAEPVNENETVGFGIWCRSSVLSGAAAAVWSSLLERRQPFACLARRVEERAPDDHGSAQRDVPLYRQPRGPLETAPATARRRWRSPGPPPTRLS